MISYRAAQLKAVPAEGAHAMLYVPHCVAPILLISPTPVGQKRVRVNSCSDSKVCMACACAS